MKSLFYFVTRGCLGLILIALSCYSCIELGEEQVPSFEEFQWSIPEELVEEGNAFDLIKSIDEPKFINADEVDFLSDDDLVIGFQGAETIRVYPFKILDYHEIVNDEIDGSKVAITYCPLTGTSLAWSRIINGTETTFGVSGLLFNANLLPFDRATESTWSQMLGRGVRGEYNEQDLSTYPLVEMPWSQWKEVYPNSEVLSYETGFDINYDQYPLGNYRQTNSLIFNVKTFDNRLFAKERTLGVVVDSVARVYRFDLMDPDGLITVVNDTIQNQPIVVVGNQHFMVAFSAEGFERIVPVQGELPIILSDNQGNSYDLFGKAVSGPNSGERLNQPDAYMVYFFAFGAMFPAPEIFEF